ncbi:HXXEE domain-containing protein [Enterococcus gilvus]|uniref:HXXEE domain-containing protein n=1 Tax=Enterococcus gilvus TaxID=160453 RepID=UPI003EDA82B9
MTFLVALLPLAYILHCIEEFVLPGNFIDWYHIYRPSLSKQTPKYYLKVNVIGFSIILVISTCVQYFHISYNSFLISATFLANNAIFTHILGSIKTRKYSPGVVTGVFLYLPICIAGYILGMQHSSIGPIDIMSDILEGSLYEIWNIYKSKKKTNPA